MDLFIRIFSFVLSVVLFFSSIGIITKGVSVAKISVDASRTSDEITNIVDNVNLWNMGESFYDPKPDENYNVFEFVKYVQLMQCTGGTAERDLFKDPYDTSTLTDYDFTRLIKNCRGILKVGAKPHLKLGGVPLKFTSGYEMGGFDMNVYPPDDYNVYYNYIRAITEALVEEFGLDEVKTWRFGCMTEYENANWFQAKTDTKSKTIKGYQSAIAYCKLYDYTVKALTDVLGEDICVGAHSMTVTEGLWDEEIFIRHVAVGKNYATGKKGTPIKFLSASFYDSKPGEFTSGYTLPETIGYLQKKAEKYGLDDLFYGVDEGRILFGNASGSVNSELFSRTVGFTWQAAYDARIFKQSIDSGMDYFSSWHYLSNGLFNGNPIMSYHIADNIADFAGSKKACTNVTLAKATKGVEVDCLSAWDEETDTLRLMVYNFKNDVNYANALNAQLQIKVPQLDGKTVTVTKRVVGDDCNFFDEWQEDRKKYNITDDCFSWSPDDPLLDDATTLSAPWAREIYLTELRDKYAECSKLVPETSEMTVENGKLEISETIGASNVVFYEIKVK